MPKAILFKDLSKDATDLLTKDFPTKLELKSVFSNADGTTFTAKVAREADGSLSGSFNPKINAKAYGVELSTTFNSSKEVEIETSIADKLADGLKLKLKSSITDASGKPNKLSTEVEYRHETFSFGSSFEIINPKGQSIKTSVFVPLSSSLGAGLEANYALGSAPQLKNLNTALLYAQDDYSALIYRNSGSNLVFGTTLFKKIRSNVKFAADVAWDVAKKPEVTVGTETALDNATVKTKFGTNGRVGFAFKTALNEYVKYIVGVEVNVADTTDHKLGLQLNVE